MGLTFEPAYDDRAEILSLFQEYTDMLVRESPTFARYLSIQHYDAEVADLRRKYGEPDGRLYLARWEGEAAGCVALHRLNSESCELKRLYVRPAFRGRGIAGALVKRILADAQEIGYRNMKLDTLPFLTAAIAMYRKLGFYDIPCYNDSPLPETIYMQLELRGSGQTANGK